MEQNIVYVDENDSVIGAGSRKNAVQSGIVHRMVRIFVFNSKGKLLIQKRAPNLVSFPDKWDESTAGHVDEGEEYLQAAIREMAEEVGIENIPLNEVGKFYAEVGGEMLIKKRFNMLYTAQYDGPVNFNPQEITEVRWIDILALKKWMDEKPDDFSTPFKETLVYYQKTFQSEG